MFIEIIEFLSCMLHLPLFQKFEAHQIPLHVFFICIWQNICLIFSYLIIDLQFGGMAWLHHRHTGVRGRSDAANGRLAQGPAYGDGPRRHVSAALCCLVSCFSSLY